MTVVIPVRPRVKPDVDDVLAWLDRQPGRLEMFAWDVGLRASGNGVFTVERDSAASGRFSIGCAGVCADVATTLYVHEVLGEPRVEYAGDDVVIIEISTTRCVLRCTIALAEDDRP